MFAAPEPRSVLTPRNQAPPQPLSSPRPLEELLQLTRLRGWGDPQYRLASFSQPRSGALLYQYSVTFPAVPFKISGAESHIKHQAFINCAQLAVEAIGQERVPSPDLWGFQYIPHHSPPPSVQSSSLLNLTNLRI